MVNYQIDSIESIETFKKQYCVQDFFSNNYRLKDEYKKAKSSDLPRELYDEEMHNTALNGERGNFDLEQAIQVMLKYKERGESVYYIFNGFELCSDKIQSLQETKEMYDLFLKEENQSKKIMTLKDAVINALRSGISLDDVKNALDNSITKENNDKGEHDEQ